MEQESVNERIKMLVEHFAKGNKSAFARSVGISNQSLAEILGARQSSPSFAALQKILAAFPQVRMEWFVFGRGAMLQNDEAPATVTIDDKLHSLTEEQWEAIQKALLELAPAKAAAQVESEWLGRTYHFGDEPTPGLPYDDRFSMRTGIVGDELQEFMNTPEYFNRLRHTKIGNRILVTERAIREWFGDLPKLS